VLEISDDGAGFPESVDPHHPASLGLQLVGSLAAQLGGRVLLERSPGTTFTVEVAA
jgi:two-component sensor histidine kinase